MAKNCFNRYIWLVDIISRHGFLSREEISDLWAKSSLNERRESYLPERTFHYHLKSIFDIFGIEIKYDKSLGYYIDNTNDFDGIRKWLLESICLNNIINETVTMRDNIIFEEIPSSQKFLTGLIEAIKEEKVVKITYQSFSKSNPSTFELKPYCLKLFKQRWYLVAKSEISKKPWIYALDRILGIEITNISYKIPKDFNSHQYFKSLYGVCTEDGKSAEFVEIKVDKSQVSYFRSLPLHHSQHEVEINEEYSIFRYYILPTYDFTQELMSKADSIEVLQPQWYREEIKDKVLRMLERYQK